MPHSPVLVLLGLNLIAYSILALLHMLSHFWVSRMLKTDLEEASLGIGPKLLKIWRTSILIRIPIIHCEHLGFKTPPPKAAAAGGQETSLSFGRLMRISLVILAGPLTSFLISACIFAYISSMGTFIHRPIIGDVLPQSPAEIAGLKKGDEIVSVDNNKIASWNELAAAIFGSSGRSLDLRVQRKTEWITLTVKPEQKSIKHALIAPERHYAIGIRSAKVAEEQKPQFRQLPKIGIAQAAKHIDTIIGGIIASINTPPVKTTIGGPIRLAREQVGEEKFHFTRFVLYTTAASAAGMALFCLLPLPICDGGHLIMALIETIRQKPICAKTRRRLRLGSIWAIVAIFIFVVSIDLQVLFANLTKFNTTAKYPESLFRF